MQCKCVYTYKSFLHQTDDLFLCEKPTRKFVLYLKHIFLLLKKTGKIMKNTPLPYS